MTLDPDICFQALIARDARFDGAFYVGVKSTKIYCRPLCPAKTPKRENCRFYPSAAAAEADGHRPCLRCRPELVPGNARIDAVSRTAALIASRIEDGALTDGGAEALAASLGISSRHLRRVTESEFGVPPIALAQTHRLLLAKRLLTDTDLPVGEIAFASGFNSLRRFNALFSERYRLNPTQLRRSRRETGNPSAADGRPGGTEITAEIAFRPPIEWCAMLAFLAGRSADGVEVIDGNRYMRTLQVGDRRGWFVAEPSPGGLERRGAEARVRSPDRSLRITLSASLAGALLPLMAGVKRLFDLEADPCGIAAHLGRLAALRPGLRVPGTMDGFELAVRAVLGQQVSVRAASTLAGRLAEAFGEPIETPYLGLRRLTPTAERIASASREDLTRLGLTGARASTLLALARAVADGCLCIDAGNHTRLTDHHGVGDTIARLIALPGIGDWTAQYIAMRAMRWPDAFPASDLVLMRELAVKRPVDAIRAAEEWRPWRAYAAMHLWYRRASVSADARVSTPERAVETGRLDAPLEGGSENANMDGV